MIIKLIILEMRKKKVQKVKYLEIYMNNIGESILFYKQLASLI